MTKPGAPLPSDQMAEHSLPGPSRKTDIALGISVELAYAVPRAAEMLLHIEPTGGPGQHVEDARLELTGARNLVIGPAEDNIGTRARFVVDDQFRCTYSATANVSRPDFGLDGLSHTALTDLPSETLRYLMPSRYCVPAYFVGLMDATFGSARGGGLIAECSRWVHEHIRYVPGASTTETTAIDTIQTRQGICRDFAHVIISMARARGIPARFVACFAPGVDPQDFHAVAEVWLDGDWRLIDPTGMAHASDAVRIGVGLDAADVAFLTIFGRAEMVYQNVCITRMSGF